MTSPYDLTAVNALLQKIQAVLARTIPHYEILELIPGVEEELRMLRQAFSDTVLRESQDVQDYCQEAITRVYKCFDDFSDGLEALESQGADADFSVIENAAHAMFEGKANLNLAFVSFQNDALVARGPTSHAGINLILNGIDRLLAGHRCTDEVRMAIEREHMLSSQALSLIGSSEQNFFTRGLKIFYSTYLGLLQSLSSKIDHIDRNALEMLKKGLEKAGDRYRRYDMNYQVEASWYEPTSIPMVNMVINSGKYYLNGKGEKEVFQYFLEELKKRFSSIQGRYDALSSQSAAQNEQECYEAQRLAAALEVFNEAITGFEHFLQTEEVTFFTRSEELLLSTVDDMIETINRLHELGQVCATVTCFSCGGENVAGEIYCSFCRALLPQVEGTERSTVSAMADGGIHTGEKSGGPVMTERVSQLFDAAQGLTDGSVTLEDYNKILREMEERLANAARVANDPPEPSAEMIQKLGAEQAERMKSLMREAASLYREGLDNFSQGLRLFRSFTENFSTQTLESGKASLWQALEKLQRAQTIVNDELMVESR
ncbi:MAG: hypothetical protein AB9903_19310 [Vulcanimicrobiota bacterium]